MNRLSFVSNAILLALIAILFSLSANAQCGSSSSSLTVCVGSAQSAVLNNIGNGAFNSVMQSSMNTNQTLKDFTYNATYGKPWYPLGDVLSWDNETAYLNPFYDLTNQQCRTTNYNLFVTCPAGFTQHPWQQIAFPATSPGYSNFYPTPDSTNLSFASGFTVMVLDWVNPGTSDEAAAINGQNPNNIFVTLASGGQNVLALGRNGYNWGLARYLSADVVNQAKTNKSFTLNWQFPWDASKGVAYSGLYEMVFYTFGGDGKCRVDVFTLYRDPNSNAFYTDWQAALTDMGTPTMAVATGTPTVNPAPATRSIDTLLLGMATDGLQGNNVPGAGFVNLITFTKPLSTQQVSAVYQFMASNFQLSSQQTTYNQLPCNSGYMLVPGQTHPPPGTPYGSSTSSSYSSPSNPCGYASNWTRSSPYTGGCVGKVCTE